MLAVQNEQFKLGNKKAGAKTLSKIFGRQLRRRILRTERQLMPTGCRNIINTTAQLPLPAAQDDVALGKPMPSTPFRPRQWGQNAAPMNMSWADPMPQAENHQSQRHPFMGRMVGQGHDQQSACNPFLGGHTIAPEQRAPSNGMQEWNSVGFAFDHSAEGMEEPAQRDLAVHNLSAYMAMVAKSTGIAVQPQRVLAKKPPMQEAMGTGIVMAKHRGQDSQKPAHPMCVPLAPRNNQPPVHSVTAAPPVQSQQPVTAAPPVQSQQPMAFDPYESVGFPELTADAPQEEKEILADQNKRFQMAPSQSEQAPFEQQTVALTAEGDHQRGISSITFAFDSVIGEDFRDHFSDEQHQEGTWDTMWTSNELPDICW